MADTLNKRRLFWLGILALFTAAAGLAIRGAIASGLKSEWIDPVAPLQAGELLAAALGAAFLSFAITLFIASALLDQIGMKRCLAVEELSAQLTTHVSGRRLDDDVAALLRLERGARGVLTASQIAAGEENGLRLRIHGEKGGLDWSQMEPNTLALRWPDRPAEMVRAGGPGLAPSTMCLLRTPAGHPEGYVEAFANLYRSFALTVREGAITSPARGTRNWFPGITDGLRTMAFVEAMIENNADTQKWTMLARF